MKMYVVARELCSDLDVMQDSHCFSTYEAAVQYMDELFQIVQDSDFVSEPFYSNGHIGWMEEQELNEFVYCAVEIETVEVDF